MAISFLLSWPPTELFPNAARRLHWAVRSRFAKEQRAEVVYCSKVVNGVMPTADDKYHRVTFLFCPPDKRSRDANGLYGAMKAAEDGIADVLEIDDKWFWPVVLEWGPVVKGGLVEVTVE